MAKKGSKQRPHTRRSVKGKRFNAGRGRPKLSKKTLGRFKNITHRQFTHFDFDKDGTKNLDDRYPFDSKRNRPIDRDSKFTEELDKLREFRKEHNKPRLETQEKLRKILKENEGVHVVSRLKTSPSLLNKLNRKYLSKVQDTAGVLVEADNKKALKKAREQIRKSELKVVKEEDFYSPENKRPYYKAIHFDIKKRKKPVEVQVKTIRQGNLHNRMHKGHKTGRDTGDLTVKQAIKEARVRDFRDSNPPASKRKLKRLTQYREEPGTIDYEEP